MSSETTKALITMPKELKTKLEEEAKNENRSLSNYIVTLLQKRNQ
ncbi:DNA-binding protein [Brevibacillus fortis]|uniref:DNA-binding protein n=1 Tax=Brevibacillus fortis TaxID=2126352 RepID=A0A2P7V3V6_9BACL|nr:DNA-binding protein [Brevibacillus fortis]PSJ93889.1 DNA-binding protein [Brevibacillus fortis]